VSGLAAVGYAKLFKVVESFTTELFRIHPLWLLFAGPAFFAAGWYSVYRYAPRAGGSGIPQVMAAIELEERRPGSASAAKLLGFRVAVVKVISSLFCVATGGAVGREGPTLQVSASVFYLFGRWFRRFTRVAAMETWLLAGAAAGLGAAFNTPLGGIVYGIEEFASKHFNRVRSTVLTAVLVAGLVSQWLVGTYLYLGFPRVGQVGLNVIPAAFVVGVVGGWLGAAFGNYLFKTTQWAKYRFRSRPTLAGFLIAVGCAFVLTGMRYVDHRSLGPGNQLISQILVGDTTSNFELVIGRVLATGVSYINGCAGGIFAPCLAIGASLGSWMSTWWHGSNAVMMSMLGMIAVLTGVTRAPFTSFVLMVEMTDRHSAIFPMMLTAVVSMGSARLMGSASFYEQTKRVIMVEIERSRRVKAAESASAPSPPPPPPAASDSNDDDDD
jgi:chloride channel protein, CIC family